MTQTRTCKACTNTPGRNVSAPFTFEGRSYPKRERPCYTCNGVVDLPAPDVAAIRAAVAGRPKAGRFTLRSARPADAIAYYVWPWARFHGGADVPLPWSASCGVARDNPWRAELDVLAEQLAQEVYGTDLAGAHRWGRALGHLDRDMPGLPDSAYSGGRVADGDKPEEEAAELI